MRATTKNMDARRTWSRLRRRGADAAADGGKLAADVASDVSRAVGEYGREAAKRGRHAADRARQQARDFDPADLATVAKPLAENIADVVSAVPDRLRSLSEDVQRIQPEQFTPDRLGKQLRSSAGQLRTSASELRASAERLAPIEVKQRGPSRPLIFLAMLLAGAVGAAMGYLLDPDRGRSRRAEAADRLGAYSRRLSRSLRGVTQDMRARSAGIQAEMRRSEWTQPVDDVTLAHKVESELFRDPSIPKGRMNINAENGAVILRGQVDSADEIEQIMAATLAIDGVRTVRSLLRTPNDQGLSDAPRELVRTRPS